MSASSSAIAHNARHALNSKNHTISEDQVQAVLDFSETHTASENRHSATSILEVKGGPDSEPGNPNEPLKVKHRILLWDLPMRIFHWSLLLAMLVAFITAKIGGNWMTLHAKAGLLIVGLLAFRLVWGVIGSKYARFSQFAPTPKKLLQYFKGQWHGHGHNPLGALSVFALLGLLLLQASSGLFTDDEISFTGPLMSLIDPDLAVKITGWHHRLSNGLLILSGLHITAIAFYVWIKKKNLIRPMLTGWKLVDASDSGLKSAGTTENAEIKTTLSEEINHPVPVDQANAKPGHWPALVTALVIAVFSVYLASGGFLNR